MGKASVAGSAIVIEQAKIFGNAVVSGRPLIRGNAKVNKDVYGFTIVDGKSHFASN
jgi:hypothetical protein